MATGKELVYPIVFDPSRARKGARDAERELERLNRSGSRALGGLKTAGIAAGAGFAALAIGAAKFGTDAVKAAMESEKALAKTKVLLDNAGISWARYGERIEAAIDAQSKLSGMDDEELLQSFGQFARVTKDVNEALRLNGLAMDISRGRGISLAAAQKTLMQVWNGNEGALKRLGIATDDIKTRQQALAAVQQQFGGSAEAYGKTAAGAADRIGVAWENFQETLGAKVLPTVARVFDAIGQVLNQQGPIWDKVRAAGQRVVDWYKENLEPTVRGVVTVVRALWNKFGDTLMNVVREAVLFIGRTLGRVKNFIQGVVEIVQGIVEGDWSKVWQGLKRAAGAALDQLIDTLKTIPATLLNAAKDIGIKIATALKDGFRSIISDIWGIIFSGGNAPSSGQILAAIRASGRAAGRRAGGGFIDGPGPAGVDSVPILAAPGEVILNEHQQRLLGPRRIMDVIRATGGVIGGNRFAAGGFVRTGYTTYGGPRDADIQDNRTGAYGNVLENTPYGFAELQGGRALGGLARGTRLLAKNPRTGKMVVIEKQDNGGGQGDDYYDIDLWYRASEALGFGNYNKGDLLYTRAPAGARVGPYSGSASGAGTGGGGGGGGGGATGDGNPAIVYPLGSRGDLIGAPYGGTHTRGNWQSDNAVDIKVPVGTPVVAVVDGTIDPTYYGAFDSSDPKLAGLRVNLHGQYNFYYAHLSRISVPRGARVTKGQVIGYSGSANGTPHLHFAVEPPQSPMNWVSGVIGASTSTGGGGGSGGGSGGGGGGGGGVPAGPSAAAVAAAQASDPRATTGVPANASTNLVTTASLNTGPGGSRAPTSNFRFDTRDEPSTGGIARPGSGAPANRLPSGWTEIPHRIYVGRAKPNMATLRQRVPGDWRIEITQAGDGRWVATAFEPVPPPAQPADGGGGGGDGGGDVSTPAPAPSLADFLAPQQAEVRKRLALASLTAGTEDDIAAANFAVEIAGHLLNLAMANGDPNLIADAANNLKSAQDFLAALQQNTDALNANTEALNNFAGAIGFSFRGQSYYIGQGRTQSSDSLLDMGVGV